MRLALRVGVALKSVYLGAIRSNFSIKDRISARLVCIHIVSRFGCKIQAQVKSLEFESLESSREAGSRECNGT